MSLTIKITNKVDDCAEFIARSILNELGQGKNVLFFVTGGSSIAVCVKVSEILREHPHQNLTVMLTDERYGPVGHNDSNWYKLIETGFSLLDAKLTPILTGEDHMTTTKKFAEALSQELKNADYKIGLFGVGADGHTAGILPETVAVNSQDFACGYNTDTFSRITMTPVAIEKLDEAVAWIQGEAKWQVLDGLKNEISLMKQPAQILKTIPLLIIFTDYTK
jgi:6-phosphogluconolactonase/glucosamine-6-phosphate isomerase/deaminase